MPRTERVFTDEIKKYKQGSWQSRKNYDHVKMFGAPPVVYPHKLLFLSRILNQGNSPKCTAYSAIAEREAMTGKQYDPEAYWRSELQVKGVLAAPGGLDLKTKMATGVTIGFTPLAGGVPTDKAEAYIEVNPTGDLDMFDTMRQAIMQQDSPLDLGVIWYRDWDDAPNGIVPHTFEEVLGGHDTKAAGFTDTDLPEVSWVNVGGVEYMVIQNSWGEGWGHKGLFFFDRYMVNKCFKHGVFYWLDTDVPEIKRLGLINAIQINIINLISEVIAIVGWENWKKMPKPPIIPIDVTPPAPVPPSPPQDKLMQWALAIEAEESSKPPRPTDVNAINNNPGNLKYASLTVSLGGSRGTPAKDGGYFCHFPDRTAGLFALREFLRLACRDELKDYHDARTLLTFTRKYANPPNDGYANNVAARLGVKVDTNIATFL